MNMISPKKLIKIARKWQKMAAISRRSSRIPLIIPRISSTDYVCTTSFLSSSVVDKGHFVVYTTDEKRFVMPLSYLNHDILRELFKMSEEEFGLSNDGPITLPCDAVFMEYVVTLIRRGAAKDLETALLRSVQDNYSSLVSSSFHQGLSSQRFLVCGY